MFVGTGIAIALSNGFAAWYFGQGILHGDPRKLELAARLFPFESRYRNGIAWYWMGTKDHAKAIEAMLAAQKHDPYSPQLAIGLVAHFVQSGQNDKAQAEFQWLERLAPNSRAVKSVREHRP